MFLGNPIDSVFAVIASMDVCLKRVSNPDLSVIASNCENADVVLYVSSGQILNLKPSGPVSTRLIDQHIDHERWVARQGEYEQMFDRPHVRIREGHRVGGRAQPPG